MQLGITREAFERRRAILQAEIFTREAQLSEVEFWLRKLAEAETPKEVEA